MPEIEINESGELDLPKSEQPAPEIGAEVKPAKHSFFDDDEGENLESGAVLLDGQKVKVRELSASEMAAYKTRSKKLAEAMKKLRAAKTEEEVERQSEAVKMHQIAIYDEIIGAVVSSWELKRPDGTPVPCTPDTKKKLRLSKRAELTDMIVQRSSLGWNDSAFLETS